MSLLLILPLLLQAGPSVGSGMAPSLNLPQIDRPIGRNRRRQAPVEQDLPTAPSRLRQCLDAAQADPAAAEATARAWAKEAAQGGLGATAQPQLCLGSALAARGQFAAAEAALKAGREAATSDAVMRAQLGAMAGNAALAQMGADKEGSKAAAARALGLLDAARADAAAAERKLLVGGIQIDRARALVALGRLPEAAEALADARTTLPEDPQGWLLSATLARRQDKLAEAQGFIQNAASLALQDADIGLEAGVIAMLGGHEEAARKSWQSVVTTAPDSEAGKRAAAYLQQIGPAPANPAR